MAIRVGRGYEAVHHPYQELYEGSRPSLQGLRAGKFLPVAFLDKLHDDDPVALLPGTFVGLLNSTNGLSTSDTFAVAEEGARALTPACPAAYTLVSSAYDVDFGTPDIDNNGAALTAAGTSTATVGPVKPVGVIAAPVYHASLPDKYTNYSRDLTPSLLCGNYSVLIPAITANEKLIEPGDLVKIDDTTSPVWDPRAVGGSSTKVAGRIMSIATGDTNAIQNEYVVGRCIHKWTIAQGTASTLLSADTVTFSGVDTNHGYATLKRVQTVPGLGLSGSGTQGIPAMFKHARSDSSGNYFALEIRIDL